MYTIVYYSVMENKSSLQSVIPVYKPLGVTPLEAVRLFKQRYPDYNDQKISYAGRLDPMAEGLLLLLIGEENKNRQFYEAMQKTYEFEMICGISTDTYDILGKVTSPPLSFMRTIDKETVSKAVKAWNGTHLQSYPPYSSRTVNGKPLYWWARNSRLDEISIPQKQITVYATALSTERQISQLELHGSIVQRIQSLRGDFRQEAILAAWKNYFTVRYTGQPIQEAHDSYPLFPCSITCSSGTYIRGIVHEIGLQLGCGAMAYSIKRMTIGSYRVADALQVTTPTQ